jgi:hypothetical protein
VTNAVTDVDHLSGIAIQAKEALGVDHVKVVADMGYYQGEEIKACEEAGIELDVAKPLTSANRLTSPIRDFSEHSWVLPADTP